MKNENYQETRKITEVTIGKKWHSISMDGTCCGMKASYGVIPKVGDELTVHTKGGSFGTIRGMDLNGKKIFWKTDEDLESERIEWLRKNEEDKQEKFKKQKKYLDASYDKLPKCFQDRIDKYRNNNPRFRVDYESYEMFCCEQAVEIAKACKTAEGVHEFQKLEWDKQKKKVKKLSDGHSGNTFGASVHLAYWYLKQPENVVKMHGALAPLVGSGAYGDVPATPNQL